MRRLGRLKRERNKTKASTGEIDRRLRYGGAWFSAASALPLTRGAFSRRFDALVHRRGARDPLSTARTRRARCACALYRALYALGMAAAGIVGMFVGATLLAVAYQLFMGWVHEDQD